MLNSDQGDSIRQLVLAGMLTALATACAQPDTSAARGHALYLAYGCAACHGPAGGGDGPAAGAAMIKPRDLQMERTFARGQSPEAIAKTIKIGFRATGMPDYPELPDDELRALATWIKSIQKENR